MLTFLFYPCIKFTFWNKIIQNTFAARTQSQKRNNAFALFTWNYKEFFIIFCVFFFFIFRLKSLWNIKEWNASSIWAFCDLHMSFACKTVGLFVVRLAVACWWYCCCCCLFFLFLLIFWMRVREPTAIVYFVRCGVCIPFVYERADAGAYSLACSLSQLCHAPKQKQS